MQQPDSVIKDSKISDQLRLLKVLVEEHGGVFYARFFVGLR